MTKKRTSATAQAVAAELDIMGVMVLRLRPLPIAARRSVLRHVLEAVARGHVK